MKKDLNDACNRKLREHPNTNALKQPSTGPWKIPTFMQDLLEVATNLEFFEMLDSQMSNMTLEGMETQISPFSQTKNTEKLTT